MGIPVYFKTLIQEYETEILKKDKLSQCNTLFLDLNCAIHPCCSGETDESKMIQNIIQKIEELITYTEVSDLVYIAIDGIPPKGKMKQQRMRRYKSILEEKPWDTNSISPGTYFMDKVNASIKEWMTKQNKKIIFSDSNERGEGEHKILQYIKKNNIQNSVIYGLDADLIMLSIVSRKDNIYLLRERTEYNIENTDNEYIYLMIDGLKKLILQDIDINAPNEIVLDDYIFMCFLLGNDFINHIPTLHLRYGGYTVLLEIYKLLQKRYQGYFQLIDLSLTNCIHLTFLKEFLQELSLKENYLHNLIQNRREKQYKYTYNKYNELFLDFKKNYPNQDETISLEDIYDYQRGCILDQESCKEMIFNLPILYWPKEKKCSNPYQGIAKDNVCKDFLDSLIWTAHYYFNECINWRWCTRYEIAPSIKDLSLYVSSKGKLSIEKESNEYTFEEQLQFIFPKESHKLHRYKIQTKDYRLKILPFHSRYLWECHIIFESYT